MIGAKKRFEVLKRDNFRCQYCWRNGKDVTLEVDHVTPKVNWGTDDFDNLITCCRECNLGKWQTELDEWNSTFNIKVKDLYNNIKKKFYEFRNDEVRSEGELFNRKFDGTIDMKTMGLIASFLQRWVDDRIKNTKKLKEIINDGISTIKECKTWERGWEEKYLNEHPLLKELSKKPSLMEEKIQEFYEGWPFFDEITSDFDWDFIANDWAFDRVFQHSRWKTDDLNERLNYTITADINELWNVPSWIKRKYSSYPNAEF